jgi:hypothetical protein
MEFPWRKHASQEDNCTCPLNRRKGQTNLEDSRKQLGMACFEFAQKIRKQVRNWKIELHKRYEQVIVAGNIDLFQIELHKR